MRPETNQNTKMKTYTELHDESEEQFKSGMRYRAEIGNCAASEYAYADTEEEAREALECLKKRWEESDIPECQGDAIEVCSINRMSADEDGDYDRDHDEEI